MSAIVSVEVVSNENRTNIGGFLVGGLLAGTAGAIVGGMTGGTAKTCAVELVGGQDMLVECTTEEFQKFLKFSRFTKREAPKDWSFLYQDDMQTAESAPPKPILHRECSCPHCNNVMTIDPGWSGQIVGCPHCGGKLIAP